MFVGVRFGTLGDTLTRQFAIRDIPSTRQFAIRDVPGTRQFAIRDIPGTRQFAIRETRKRQFAIREVAIRYTGSGNLLYGKGEFAIREATSDGANLLYGKREVVRR